jgi:hypothetical protein
VRKCIVSQGISGCGGDDEDDGSSDGEWVDISHSSEDDAEENIGTQEDAFDRLEDDQRGDRGTVDEDVEEDEDKVSSHIQGVTESCSQTETRLPHTKTTKHQHVAGNI